ncbi:uncharacterized protein HMPREF1541_09056 [Cyphellophora europaea CBS 101466]|uniref:Cytochrome b5 heme-binding domain-containing protein n=1 Tax=Cyphellophora europaea (strain CBS 101466) TaxID=1220924 RepID=W2RM48_CYPE1|nr:uncharacterized protein HMPREF1541_09056 [Cyphellophora europaea CBS 101466]ETN36778.1 hypothetical protein HMPREF1541_09056 [Cyphellophora europaea CBS 101466]
MASHTLPRTYSKDSQPSILSSCDIYNLAPVSKIELAAADGTDPAGSTWVAILGIVFDVSSSKAFALGGPYHIYAGKDPSRALALSSVRPEDCIAELADLEDVHKTVLGEWYARFKQTYQVVGRMELPLSAILSDHVTVKDQGSN